MYAESQIFLSYVNSALSRALLERLAKWGRDYIDPESGERATDRNGKDLGVTVFRAFSCEFGLNKPPMPKAPAMLALTVDLRAKLIRSSSVLDWIYQGRDPNTSQLSPQDRKNAERYWIGETVIYKEDRKCYTVVGLRFDHSANSLPVEGLTINGRTVSHSEYFLQRKKKQLNYPNAKPMITVLGRRKQHIYLPAELICGNELDPQVKEKLPMIASFTPEARNKAIETIKKFLVPGAQKTKGAGGLLPAIGINLRTDRLNARAEVLPAPMLLAAGVKLPERENWANELQRAKFNVDSRRAVTYNVVVFYNHRLKNGAEMVYNKIRDFVNQFQAQYRFGSRATMVEAGKFGFLSYIQTHTHRLTIWTFLYLLNVV